MPAERGEDRGLSRGGGRGSEGQSTPTARLRAQQVWGPTSNSKAARPRRGRGRLDVASLGRPRHVCRRVLGSCPGGQRLGQGGAAEEQAGRTPGLAGRAGSPAAAPRRCGDGGETRLPPLCARLGPLVWRGVGVTPRAPRSMGRRAPQPEARLARHGQRGKRCRAPSARLGRNQGGPTRAVTTRCRQEQGRAP